MFGDRYEKRWAKIKSYMDAATERETNLRDCAFQAKELGDTEHESDLLKRANLEAQTRLHYQRLLREHIYDIDVVLPGEGDW